MADKLADHVQRNPSKQQTPSANGVYKGVIVDVRDPSLSGRVRVYIYPLHGDLINVNVEALLWAEMGQFARGSFAPAEIGDRALVSFENADKKAPIVLAYWRATPMGGDRTLWSSRVGSEIRPEAWHHHDLYPEAAIIAMSGAGNGMWTQDKLLGKNLASVIQIEDTGGNVIRAMSFHLDCEGYAAFTKYDGGIGKMLDKEGTNKAVRDGVSKPEPVTGAIEFKNHNISRRMVTDKESFSLDQMHQLDEDETVGIAQENLNGKIHRTRQGTTNMSMAGGVLSLTGKVISIMPLFTPPRIW